MSEQVPAPVQVTKTVDPITSLQQLVQDATRACRERERMARRARKQWERVLKLLPDGQRRPFALLAALDDLAKEELEQGAAVARVREWALAAAHEQLMRYRELMVQALPADMSLEGRLDEGYRICQVILVRIDTRTNRARVGTWVRLREIKGDISPETVAEAVRAEWVRLFERPFDAERMLADLWKAYGAALAMDSRPGRIGEPVGILTVHRLLLLERQPPSVVQAGDERHFQPYPLDEFAIDLGKLLASGRTVVNGRVLHLHPGRNPRDSVVVINPATGLGQNYALLSFRQLREGDAHGEFSRQGATDA